MNNRGAAISRGVVSVVVLNHNRADTTVECLEAIRAASSPLLKEVLVVDNGSAEPELEILRRYVQEPERLVEIGVNRYFGEGNNIGAEEAAGEFIVFLNNDAFVSPGWIEGLLEPIIDDPGVGAVGALLRYPDGRIQEVGSMISPIGDAVQLGKGSVWSAEHYTDVYPVDYCSACCLLMRKESFTRVGGFSFEFEPAYYEDADLCLKIWRDVGKVVVNPRVRITHIESHTTSDRWLELEGIVLLNRQKFLDLWGEWLRSRSFGTKPFDSRGESGGRAPNASSAPHRKVAHSASTSSFAQSTRAVVYTPYELVPGGGERFIFELCAQLASRMGSGRVALATPNRYSTIRVSQIAQAFGFSEPAAVPVAFDAEDLSRADLGFVVGNTVVPPVRAYARRNIYLCQFPFTASDSYVEDRREWLADFDEIWVYSEFALRYTRAFARHYDMVFPPIRVMNPPAAWPFPDNGLPWRERKTLLAVGRFFTSGHNKRQDVVIDVARELAARGWHLDLVIAGALHATASSRDRFNQLVELAVGIPCRFYPNASRFELARLYASSAFLVHATGFGVDPVEHPERLEHFGIAPVEAASFGCIPLAYGEGGLVEVISALGEGATFHTVAECADLISRYLSDPEASERASQALVCAAEQFSSAAFGKRVNEALDNLGVDGAW